MVHLKIEKYRNERPRPIGRVDLVLTEWTPHRKSTHKITRFTLQGRGAKHLFILAVMIIMLTSCFNLNYVTERHEHYTTSGRVEDIGVSVAS